MLTSQLCSCHLILAIIVGTGADLKARDSNGNTALHMCVLWKLKEMYVFLEGIGKKQGLKDLSMVRNNVEPGLAHGLTCMQLAVFTNDGSSSALLTSS